MTTVTPFVTHYIPELINIAATQLATYLYFASTTYFILPLSIVTLFMAALCVY